MRFRGCVVCGCRSARVDRDRDLPRLPLFWRVVPPRVVVPAVAGLFDLEFGLDLGVDLATARAAQPRVVLAVGAGDAAVHRAAAAVVLELDGVSELPFGHGLAAVVAALEFHREVSLQTADAPRLGLDGVPPHQVGGHPLTTLWTANLSLHDPSPSAWRRRGINSRSATLYAVSSRSVVRITFKPPVLVEKHYTTLQRFCQE